MRIGRRLAPPILVKMNFTSAEADASLAENMTKLAGLNEKLQK